MGQGAYNFCELASVQNNNRPYQLAMKNLEAKTTALCLADWAPKGFNMTKALSPQSGDFGRTTILPAVFDDHNAAPMISGTWRQLFTTASSATTAITLIQGVRSGDTIPEDMKIGWIGLAFPNKQQHVTEVKWQIGDRKYGRINLEEMHQYDTPALIFNEGFILDEETSFHLYGTIEGPIPTHHNGYVGLHQSIVMLGLLYFKNISKVLGNTGAAIP